MDPARHISASTLSLRLTVISVAGFLVATSFLLGFAYWAMQNVDRSALVRQTGFAVSGVQQVLDRVPRDQESVTIWDDAVQRVRAGDNTWIEENLGQWMGSYFGHDEVYVLDPADDPVHAMRDLETVPVSAYADRRQQIAPLVANLRAEMAAASAGEDAAAAAVGELNETALLLLDGVPAMVSARPIVPSSDAVALEPGREYLHVAIRRIDAELLGEVAEQFDLAELSLHRPDAPISSETSAPIWDPAGRILGSIEWQGDRPGTRMLLTAVPGLVAAIVIGGGLLLWLLLRLRRSTSELYASEAQAQFLAFHDTLTGLPNRALLDDRLDRALAEARRTGRMVAVHAIDIDRFKNVNDSRGHPAGDELIRLVAARLSATVRETDTVARHGGDEFVVVQTGLASIADAERAAERMLEAIGEPSDLFGERAYVSASIGVVASSGADADREEMLRKADIALYEAKARGRGRYEVFAGDMDDAIRQRRMIEVDLQLALELGSQLKLVYQPVFGNDGKVILGAEALVRWDHPLHGRMPPDQFIPIAEERALIEPLGEFVLAEAAAFARRANLPWVAVNVSPIQFRNNRFAQKVAAILAEARLPPQRLQLEITEGVLLENAALIESTLEQLRASGVRVVLDDFGTGYSSMSYLRRYAIDKLKIDRSFIAELGSSRDADAIVRAMIGLGRSLKLQVTAEGIETVEQRDHLAAIGCHELQGFLLSRPLEEEQLLAIWNSQGEMMAKSA